jgi:hypothetical protein
MSIPTDDRVHQASLLAVGYGCGFHSEIEPPNSQGEASPKILVLSKLTAREPSMTQSNTTISFKVFRGTTFLREEVLQQAVIKVGNLASSHLRLVDEGVSRMHSVIELSGERVSIIDLGSTAGTFVNGQRVNKATLNSGDTIAIGELRIVVGFSFASETLDKTSTNATPPAIPTTPAAPAMASFSAAPAPTALPALEPSPNMAIAGEQSVEVTAMLGE